MRQILLFAALAASLALLSGCVLSKTKADTAEDAPGKAAYHKISAEEAYEMMASQEVVVVDVRTRKEYDGGHIENAVLVPSESIGKRCSTLRNSAVASLPTRSVGDAGSAHSGCSASNLCSSRIRASNSKSDISGSFST